MSGHHDGAPARPSPASPAPSSSAPSPSSQPSRIQSWLELARASNVATCLSNTLVGAAIGWRAAATTNEWSVTTAVRLAVTALAIGLLYVAGMILNDVVDATLDARERPARPIPSGRISRRNAMIAFAACVAAALAVLTILAPVAAGVGLLLVAVIVAYDLLHQRSGGVILLMGLSRALVYAVAAAAFGWPLDARLLVVFGATIFVYIVALSTVARIEAQPSSAGARGAGQRLAPMVLSVAPLAPLLVVRPSSWPWTILAAIVLFAWIQHGTMHLLATPSRRREAVMSWIAAISLVDALFLCMLDHPLLALLAGSCIVATTVAHRRIAGT
ncbi:MAG: UbiA family prenyltransferase [Phycisphaerales bacterium]